MIVSKGSLWIFCVFHLLNLSVPCAQYSSLFLHVNQEVYFLAWESLLYVQCMRDIKHKTLWKYFAKFHS